MSDLPWFKFFPSDFMGSGKVGMMSPSEVGIYIKLLCVSWQEGPLPDDPGRLWRVAGATPEEMEAAWPAVRRCWDTNADGRLVNRKLERERAAAIKRSERASAAASAKQAQRTAPRTPSRSAPRSASRESLRVPYSDAQSSESQSLEPDEEDTGPSAELSESPEYTKGELLELANTVLGKGALPRHEQNRNSSILTSWDGAGIPRRQQFAAIHGLRIMADTADPNVSDWLKPGEVIGLRALRNTGAKLGRELIDVAADVYHRSLTTEGTRSTGLRSVADLLDGAA